MIRTLVILCAVLMAVGCLAQVLTAPMPNPHQQFFNANGVPLAGGKLYSYSAGTTTPLATYKDASGQAKNTNPVILDASGSGSVWLSSSAYKLVLKDASDQLIWSADNIVVPHGTPLSYRGTWESTIQYTTGDMVTYSGSLYISLVEINQSNQPDTSATQWSVLGYTGVSSDGASGITVTGGVASASMTSDAGTFKTLNGVCNAAAQAETDAGDKVNACITAGATEIDATGIAAGEYSTTISTANKRFLHIRFAPSKQLVYTGSGSAFLSTENGDSENSDYLSLYGLNVRCSSATGTYGIRIQGSWYSTFDRVKATGCGTNVRVSNDGPNKRGSYFVRFFDSVIGDDTAHKGAKGIVVESLHRSGVNYTQFYNTWSTYATGDGFTISSQADPDDVGAATAALGTSISGGGSSYNGGKGVNLTACDPIAPATESLCALTLDVTNHSDFEGNTGGFYCNENVIGVSGEFDNADATNCAAYGVRIRMAGQDVFMSNRNGDTPVKEFVQLWGPATFDNTKFQRTGGIATGFGRDSLAFAGCHDADSDNDSFCLVNTVTPASTLYVGPWYFGFGGSKTDGSNPAVFSPSFHTLELTSKDGYPLLMQHDVTNALSNVDFFNGKATISPAGVVGATGFQTGSAPGLTVTKTVKNSSGSNCTLTFTGGLLTASTC